MICALLVATLLTATMSPIMAAHTYGDTASTQIFAEHSQEVARLGEIDAISPEFEIGIPIEQPSLLSVLQPKEDDSRSFSEEMTILAGNEITFYITPELGMMDSSLLTNDSNFNNMVIADFDAALILQESEVFSLDSAVIMHHPELMIVEDVPIVRPSVPLPEYILYLDYYLHIEDNADNFFFDNCQIQILSSNVVTITYHGGVGAVGTPPASHSLTTPGQTTLRHPTALSRANHIFAGWRDGNGSVFTAGANILFEVPLSGTLHLTAVWVPSIVTIEYRSTLHTIGNIPQSQSLVTPGQINLRPQGNLIRLGHTFAGWRDSAGNIFAPEQRVNFAQPASGTVILYAHWHTNVVTVTYHGNGNTSGAVPGGHTVSTPGSFGVRHPGNLARSGSVFDGWSIPAFGAIVQPSSNHPW